MTGTVQIEPSEANKRFNDEFWELVIKYSEDVTQLEFIAILSNFLGKITASQNTITVDKAYQIINLNLRRGMVEAISAIEEDKQRKAEVAETTTSAGDVSH